MTSCEIDYLKVTFILIKKKKVTFIYIYRERESKDNFFTIDMIENNDLYQLQYINSITILSRL